MSDSLCVGEKTAVNFALGRSTVSVIGKHKVADGDVIYHVEDTKTGHQDFVGSKWVNT